MSNNKQTMKLYNEKQLERAMDLYKRNVCKNRIVESLTPIELPSDEEIEEMGKDVIVYNDTKRGWFVEGLKCMRDKIQGGNK